MDIDFVIETKEDDRTARATGWLTGWESVVFELEDETEEPRYGALSTAAIAP